MLANHRASAAGLAALALLLVLLPSAAVAEGVAVVRPNVHVLDSLRSAGVDSLLCAPDHLDVGVDSAGAAALRSWGSEFVVVASSSWGCGYVLRRVHAVAWPAASVARLATSAATLADVFESASARIAPTSKRFSHTWSVSPVNASVSWNKGAQGALVSPVQLWQASCSDCAVASPAPAFCSLCPQGALFESSAQCVDCWATAELNLVELIIGVELGSISLEAKLNATADVHLAQLKVSLSTPGALAATLPLVHAPLVSSQTFELAGVPIEVSASADWAAVVNVSQSDGCAAAALSLAKTLAFSLDASSASQRAAVAVSAPAGTASVSAVAATSARLSAELGLRASVSVAVQGAGSAYAAVEPVLAATAAFSSSPAFAPRAAAGLVGDCSARHLVEFDARLSVRSEGRISAGSQTWNAGAARGVPEAVASGCLLGGDVEAVARGVALDFDAAVSGGFAGVVDAALASELAREVARALNATATSVRAAIAGARVNVTLVAERAEEALRMLGELRAQAANRSSALWQQRPVMAQLLQSYSGAPDAQRSEQGGAATSVVACAAAAAAAALLALF
eukprot:m51a1_g8046 hypothetical protein (571) ;mRNA; f:88245-90656